jgi:hypothetical protein
MYVLVFFKPHTTPRQLKNASQTWEDACHVFLEDLKSVDERMHRLILAQLQRFQMHWKAQDASILKRQQRKELAAKISLEASERQDKAAAVHEIGGGDDSDAVQLAAVMARMKSRVRALAAVKLVSAPSVVVSAAVPLNLSIAMHSSHDSWNLANEKKRAAPVAVVQTHDSADFVVIPALNFDPQPLVQGPVLVKLAGKPTLDLEQLLLKAVATLRGKQLLVGLSVGLCSVIDFLREQGTIIPVEPLRLILLGGPGTGKTHSITAGLDIAEQLGVSQNIFKCATTAFAAIGLRGETVQSRTNKKAKRGRSKGAFDAGTCAAEAAHVSFTICDEISMMTLGMLASYSEYFSAAKSKVDVPFGGCHSLLAGDFNQLPPPGSGRPLYHQYMMLEQLDLDNLVANVLSGLEAGDVAGIHTFHLFRCGVVLDESIRQESGPLRDICDNLQFGYSRHGARQNDIIDRDFRLLNSRLVSNNKLDLHSGKFSQCPYILWSNVDVAAFNSKLVIDHSKNLNACVFAIDCEDILARRSRKDSDELTYQQRIDLRNLEYKPEMKIPGRLLVFQEMRGIVTDNVLKPLVVNGFSASVRMIKFDDREDLETLPITMIDGFAVRVLRHMPQFLLLYSENWPFKYEGLENGVFPLAPGQATFKTDIVGGGRSIRRRGFFFAPCYAGTAYRFQGATLKSGVIDLSDKHLSRNAMLVMLSRFVKCFFFFDFFDSLHLDSATYLIFSSCDHLIVKSSHCH